jgi:hypothetical protein
MFYFIVRSFCMLRTVLEKYSNIIFLGTSSYSLYELAVIFFYALFLWGVFFFEVLISF